MILPSPCLTAIKASLCVIAEKSLSIVCMNDEIFPPFTFFQGVLTLFITNPIWVTKTQLVLQYSADRSRKQYKGMVDALAKIYKYEGIPGLYRVGCHTKCKLMFEMY